MRQWWNKLPMYGPEGKGGRPLVVVNGDFGRRHKPHQDEPDLDDDDDPPPAKKGKKGFETEEVTVNGKKFVVPKGMGEEINKLSGGKGNKVQVDNLQQVRAMFEELLDKRMPPKKTKKAAESDDDDDDLDDSEMFTDPKAYRKKLTEKLTKQIMSQVSTAYNADQGQKTFWQNFYGRNEDLEPYDFIVKAVLQENSDELMNMETKAAGKKLAEYTREKLIEIGKKAGKGKKDEPGAHVEGSGTARRSARDTDVEETDQDAEDRKNGMPMTLGAMLKARREQRRKPLSRTAEE